MSATSAGLHSEAGSRLWTDNRQQTSGRWSSARFHQSQAPHRQQCLSPGAVAAPHLDAVWGAATWRRGWWIECLGPRWPSPTRTAWHPLQTAHRGSVTNPKVKDVSLTLRICRQKRPKFSSQTRLCKYELCSEVDAVQFIHLLHVPPLQLYQVLYGVLQLLAAGRQIDSSPLC